MERSENINELAAALAKAQLEYGVAKKDSENPAYKSKYADLANIIAATREALCKNGLSVCQLLGEKTLTTILMHSSGQWIQTVSGLHGADYNKSHTVGSACTYARRYAMCAILGIHQDDDDGNASTRATKQQLDILRGLLGDKRDEKDLQSLDMASAALILKVLSPVVPVESVAGALELEKNSVATPEQISSIKAMAGYNLPKLVEHYGPINKITYETAQNIIAMLEKRNAKQVKNV